MKTKKFTRQQTNKKKTQGSTTRINLLPLEDHQLDYLPPSIHDENSIAYVVQPDEPNPPNAKDI